MLRLLGNRNVIFGLAVGLGLALPHPAQWTAPAMMPALALVMTLATIHVPNSYFRDPRAILAPSLAGIAMTYIVLGGVILTASALVVRDPNLWIGFVLIAAVPPAVAVIPFTAILEGDISYTLSGTVASYLAALLVMPVMFIVLVGTAFADPYKLIRIMLLLIVLPLILSRLILYLGWAGRIESFRGLLTDWGFFIVLYSMIGVNRDLIFSQPMTIAPVALVVLASTFGLGAVVEKAGVFLKKDPPRIVSLVLLGTLKNQGIAGGLAMALFEKEAALPSAVYSVFMIVYILWLDLRHQRRKRGLTA
jgi:BASS family bile acid:Na+ symporter